MEVEGGKYRPVPGPLWGGVIAKTDRATSARKWRWPGVLYVGRRTLRSPARKEAWRAPEPRSEDRTGGSRPRRRSQDSGRPAGGRPSTAAPQGPPSHPGRRAGTWGRGRARGGGGDGGWEGCQAQRPGRLLQLGNAKAGLHLASQGPDHCPGLKHFSTCLPPPPPLLCFSSGAKYFSILHDETLEWDTCVAEFFFLFLSPPPHPGEGILFLNSNLKFYSPPHTPEKPYSLL